jgi:hypothetical protein
MDAPRFLFYPGDRLFLLPRRWPRIKPSKKFLHRGAETTFIPATVAFFLSDFEKLHATCFFILLARSPSKQNVGITFAITKKNARERSPESAAIFGICYGFSFPFFFPSLRPIEQQQQLE